MEDKTLFVLPLEDRYKCGIHKGVLKEPVKAVCGHTFCKACTQKEAVCPIDGTSLNETETKSDIQADVNELLCYCKYGVTTTDAGKLVADPKGCDHIIKYGNKAQHEATCEFRDDSFIMINKSEEAQAGRQTQLGSSNGVPARHNLLPCPNKEDGCFFLAESEEERKLHLANECPYERLRALLRQSEARVQLLEKEIQLRDQEIAELHAELDSRNGGSGVSTFARKTVDGGKELLEELVRILEEELPHGLSMAKDQISPITSRTSTAISAFKSTVMRKTSDVKRGLSQVHPIDKLGEINPLAGAHPIDRLIAILSQLKQGIVTAVQERTQLSITNGSSSSSNNNNNNNSLIKDATDEKLQASGEFTDEDTQKQIAASLATYEAEQQSRLALEEKEAAAIAAAAALSLTEGETPK